MSVSLRYVGCKIETTSNCAGGKGHIDVSCSSGRPQRHPMTYSLLFSLLAVSLNVKMERNTADERFLVSSQLQFEKFQDKIPIGLVGHLLIDGLQLTVGKMDFMVRILT